MMYVMYTTCVLLCHDLHMNVQNRIKNMFHKHEYVAELSEVDKITTDTNEFVRILFLV
jgi:hypothetical protein